MSFGDWSITLRYFSWGGGLKDPPLPRATEPIFDSMLIKVHANLGYFWVLSSWKFVTWLPNNEINQNITLYSCFWHYNFFHILNLGSFGLYLAIFGYPGFLPIFHSYLKLKYIKLEHFKPILGFEVGSSLQNFILPQFGLFLTSFGHFWVPRAPKYFSHGTSSKASQCFVNY